MNHFLSKFLWLILLSLACRTLAAGPYSAGDNISGDGTAIDEPIPGWVGDDGIGLAKIRVDNGTVDPSDDSFLNPNNTLNPVFKAWASRVVDYSPAGTIDPDWVDTDQALGPATGDAFLIVSLGEMTQAQIDNWLGDPINNPGPGSITLGFPVVIANGEGPDFAVFENALYQTINMMFIELAYVEVSTDGVHFARFPSDSLTPAAPGPYGGMDPTNLHNLAGKHLSGYEESWGTPFDLEDLADDPLVLAGTVDLQEIRFVRLVDIPGTGDFLDADGDPIYDPWETWGSSGFDLDAVGVINVPGEADAVSSWLAAHYNLTTESAIAELTHVSLGDGVTNLMELALGLNPRVNNSGAVPRPVVEQISGQPHLVLRYSRNLALQSEGMLYEVLVAEAPGAWQPAGLGLIDELDPDVSPNPQGDVAWYRARIPLSAGGQRYLKLRVTWNP